MYITKFHINLGIHVLLSKLNFILWLYMYMFLHSVLARVGLMHIGVFILLLLSGERNFGVRLNKPYSVRVPMDIPVFTGTHADFLIIVSLYFTSSIIQYKFLAAVIAFLVILYEMNFCVFCYMCITLQNGTCV